MYVVDGCSCFRRQLVVGRRKGAGVLEHAIKGFFLFPVCGGVMKKIILEFDVADDPAKCLKEKVRGDRMGGRDKF